MSKQKITQENDGKKYFTMFPNIIDDSSLDPYEFRLLVHYYRVGNCWEGTRTTAEKCKMSVGAVSKKRLSLSQKGWITLKKGTQADTIKITVTDKWDENMRHFTRSPQGLDVHQANSKCSPGEQSVHSVNSKCSLSELKKTNIKNNNKERKDRVATAPPPPPPSQFAHLKRPKSKPKQSNHHLLMAAYQNALGHKIANGGREGKAARLILENGYSIDEAMACYRHMKADKFWAKKMLSLQSVYKELGNFLKNNKPEPERVGGAW